MHEERLVRCMRFLYRYGFGVVVLHIVLLRDFNQYVALCFLFSWSFVDAVEALSLWTVFMTQFVPSKHHLMTLSRVRLVEGILFGGVEAISL